MKFCKDCKYFSPREVLGHRSKDECSHPKNMELVCGTTARMAVPGVLRQPLSHCGADGKWWEAK